MTGWTQYTGTSTTSTYSDKNYTVTYTLLKTGWEEEFIDIPEIDFDKLENNGHRLQNWIHRAKRLEREYRYKERKVKVITFNNQKRWYIKDTDGSRVLHREDGPADIRKKTTIGYSYDWYLYGLPMTYEEWSMLLKLSEEWDIYYRLIYGSDI